MFSLHCSTTDSSQMLRKFLRINRPHIKRTGLLGRPLSRQYNGVKASSNFFHSIFCDSLYKGCCWFSKSSKEENKDWDVRVECIINICKFLHTKYKNLQISQRIFSANSLY